MPRGGCCRRCRCRCEAGGDLATVSQKLTDVSNQLAALQSQEVIAPADVQAIANDLAAHAAGCGEPHPGCLRSYHGPESDHWPDPGYCSGDHGVGRGEGMDPGRGLRDAADRDRHRSDGDLVLSLEINRPRDLRDHKLGGDGFTGRRCLPPEKAEDLLVSLGATRQSNDDLRGRIDANQKANALREAAESAAEREP